MVFYIDTGQSSGHAGFIADVIGGTLVALHRDYDSLVVSG
jgi:hypothetical protein